jgi:hypothetical protein
MRQSDIALEGKTYCFGSKEAMAEFMKSPKENLVKAAGYYSSIAKAP